jgi:hypothetical protein
MKKTQPKKGVVSHHGSNFKELYLQAPKKDGLLPNKELYSQTHGGNFYITTYNPRPQYHGLAGWSLHPSPRLFYQRTVFTNIPSRHH